MSEVTAAAAPASGPPTFGRVTDRIDAYRDPVGTVLERASTRLDDDVLLVPDTSYPFHPSTGLVTDPAVVGALATELRDRGATVSVAMGGGPHVDGERAASLLGYPRILDAVGAVAIEPDQEGERRICHWNGSPEESTWFSVPAAFVEHSVIVVPSLRPTESGCAAGALRTLARAIEPNLPDIAAVAAMDVADPTLAILDGATAFLDEPRSAGVLVSGAPVAVDAVATRLLDMTIRDDPVLRDAVDSSEVTVECAGLDLEQVRRSLPKGRYPDDPTPGPLVSRLYGIYATLANDAIPPQLDQ